jgi:hypothetical protein
VAQNRALLRQYQLQFGRAIPEHYFTVQSSHYVVGHTENTCDHCHQKAKVNKGYFRREARALPDAHEYVGQLWVCDACLTKPAYDIVTIHEIHRKSGFHLED